MGTIATLASLQGEGTGLYGQATPAAEAAPLASGNTATEAQERFLAKLTSERGEAGKGIAEVIEIARANGKLTKQWASKTIDYLKNDLPVVDSAPPNRRANRYAATCVDCGVTVAEGDGWIVKSQTGRWETRHNECPAVEVLPEVTDGFYSVDGTIYKVQEGTTSGNLYAKRESDGRFDYAPGGIGVIAKALADGTGAPLSKEDAAAWGKLYGRCVMCSRTLTDEDSIAAGIGPVCAKKGWG